MVEPLNAPMITPIRMARMDSLPRSFPSHLSRTLTAFSPRPDMKDQFTHEDEKGTGRRVKVVIDVKAPVTTP